MTSRRLPEGENPNLDGTTSRFCCAVNNVCINCGQPCVSGWFLTLGHPYHAVLHWECRAWIPNDGEWPHPAPAAQYMAGNHNNLSLGDKSEQNG